MSYRWEISAAIAAERIVAVVRADSADAAVKIGTTLIDAGIRVVEVALTTPDGVEAVRELASARGTGDGRIVGAGTVLDASSARLAVLAGARFLVSPTLVADVVEMGHRYSAAVIPGAHTPTEIEQALSSGADMVKLFPASALSIGYLQAVRAALPQAPIVPTGGMSAADVADWREAGAVAVGVGGSLTSGDRQSMTERAHELLEMVGRRKTHHG